MSIFKSHLFKSASLLTLSQIFALLVSAVLILILPKFISVDDYGYWQLFILYSGYVGLFHFGYSDGLYITLGGKKLAEVDHTDLKKQFTVFIFFQFVFSVFILLFSFSYFHEVNKFYVFFAVGIFLIIENCHKLLSFMLLATANSNSYAKSVIIDKVLTVILLVLLIAFHELSFQTILLIYIFCRFVSLIYLLLLYREFMPVFININEFKSALKNVFSNCKLGIVLTISNVLGTLIIASGRLVVEYSWSIASFAQISLAVSLSFFIMSFISQISLILFPILCNAENSVQKKILKDGSVIVGYITMWGFGFYFLTYLFIKFWLTDYQESLSYLIYLFPIVLFEIKTQILYTTYCKSINKLRLLFNVNLLVIAAALILYFIASNLHSIELVLITMLFALMLRSILLNLFLYQYYELKLSRYFYIEIIFSVIFILINKFFNIQNFFFFFVLSMICITLLYYKDLKLIFINFKNRKNGV